jgi:hypothetical protein
VSRGDAEESDARRPSTGSGQALKPVMVSLSNHEVQPASCGQMNFLLCRENKKSAISTNLITDF